MTFVHFTPKRTFTVAHLGGLHHRSWYRAHHAATFTYYSDLGSKTSRGKPGTMTRVVVCGDRPGEEKLEDAQWWGIPVVDAAALGHAAGARRRGHA